MPRKPKKARIFVSTAPKKTLGQKVNQIINSKSETKSHGVSQQYDFDSTADPNPSQLPIGFIGKIYSLTRINVGDRNGLRVGDKINPQSLEMNYSLTRSLKAQPKSVQQVRVTLFRTYNPLNAQTEANGGDLPDGIQRNWNLAKVDVLYDKYHTLTEEHDKVDVCNKVYRRLPKIFYGDNTADGCRRGNIYLRFQCYGQNEEDNGAFFSMRMRLKYKDF